MTLLPREPWFRGFRRAITTSWDVLAVNLPSSGLGTEVAGEVTEAGGLLTTTESCRNAPWTV